MNQEKEENTGRIILVDAKLESVNPFKEALTVEKLKTFEGLENLNEEEAKQIVNDIHTLCGVIYDFLTEGSVNKESTSETINNDNNQQKQAA